MGLDAQGPPRPLQPSRHQLADSQHCELTLHTNVAHSAPVPGEQDWPRCCRSAAQSCPTLCDPMDCSTPGFPVLYQLPELLKIMSIDSVMPSKHLILCRPLLLLPSIFPSIRIFSSESVLRITWPKYWRFSFSISPSSKYPGLIYFRMDWLDLLEVQETLRSLLQNHSSKASILQCSDLFKVQLSHPYMTTGKTTALTRRTFVSKVMSLLFNIAI